MNEQFTFFYKSDHPFSQWYMSDFEIDGIAFNCAEQYMMYAKAQLFEDQEMAEKILAATNPEKHKAYGRLVKHFDNAIWNQEAKKIVYKANYAKFTQNPNLKKFLLKTSGTTLVEASRLDTIWGIGLDEQDPARFDRTQWLGKNWLGKVLTKLRDDLLAVYN